MSNLRATGAGNQARAKPRQLKRWLIVYGVLACVAIGLAVAGQNLFVGTTEPTSQPENRPSVPHRAPPPTAAASSIKSQPPAETEPPSVPLVDDDGKTLWVSPTNGRPVDLAYLSPGAQIIVVLRPAALLKHPEGEKVRAALGPAAQAEIEWVEEVAGIPLTDMERLIVGGNVLSDGNWLVTFVVHTTKAIARDAFPAKLPGATEKKHRGKKYWEANERTYYLPSAARGKVLVVAPVDAIKDVIDLAGNAPPLRRDIERLIEHTDADRHVTIIVAPNSLFSEGQSIFANELTRLREPLFWFLGDELSGAALSMNWGDDFFLELSATPTLETSPARASHIFSERIAKLPDKIEAYVSSLNAQPYGRPVVSRFPAMVRKLATYTRSGFDRDHAVLRCFLPVVAGHNLLLAAELTLAEPPSGAMQVASSNATSANSAASSGGASVNANDGLAKATSLRFAKDTLEAALEQLSQDIGVPIVIRGPDLQADGITKNQSFKIDISNKPAREILVEVLRQANPDKEATGPSDPRQKLVYVIEPTADKTEQIVVTTRAKAAERKTELPAVFRAAKP